MRAQGPRSFIPFLLALAALLAACGDDDPTAPVAPGDTTPPIVIATRPLDGTGGVDLHEALEVHFNEAMDRDSAQGNVTVTGTTITELVWDDDRALFVHHEGFAEGSRDTLTLGRGLTDLAGNGLATAFEARFLTVSPDLVVMGVSPAAGATGVPLNVGIILRLSESVEPGAIADAVTLGDETAAGSGKAAIGFTVQDRRYSTYALVPDADLPAGSVIQVHVSDELATPSGKTPAAPVDFSFTTGTERDTTPPAIVAVEPPNGATDVSPNQGFLRFTFSEPIARMAAPTPVNLAYDLIWGGYFGEQTGQWNAARTQLTFGLPPDLPAGMPLDLMYGELEDMNGVLETAPFPYEIKVAGPPDYLPFADGDRYLDWTVVETGPLGEPATKAVGFQREWIRIDYLTADTFREANYFNANPSGDPFLVPTGTFDAYRRTIDAFQWLGWQVAESDPTKSNEFGPPLTILPLPITTGTWMDASSVTVPEEGTYAVELAGTVLPRQDRVLPRRGGQVFVKDAWIVVLELRWEMEGVPTSTQRDTIIHAPGFGPVKRISYQEDHLEAAWQRKETTRWPYSETALFGAGSHDGAHPGPAPVTRR